MTEITTPAGREGKARAKKSIVDRKLFQGRRVPTPRTKKARRSEKSDAVESFTRGRERESNEEEGDEGRGFTVSSMNPSSVIMGSW